MDGFAFAHATELNIDNLRHINEETFSRTEEDERLEHHEDSDLENNEEEGRYVEQTHHYTPEHHNATVAIELKDMNVLATSPQYEENQPADAPMQVQASNLVPIEDSAANVQYNYYATQKKKSPPLMLEWKNLSYTVMVGKLFKKQPKTILYPMSGFVAPGTGL